MAPFLTERFGNPSSLHAVGDDATDALEGARRTVAAFLGAAPEEIVFTSGATEANNLALVGYAMRNRRKGNHVIISEMEHISIHNIAKHLERNGFEVGLPLFWAARHNLNVLLTPRYMHRRGEDTAWVIWDPEASGFISRFGEVTAIEGVRPPRQLELLPYVVASATNPAEDPPDDETETFQNLGLDLKYGLTADLTLNATIQPDFGQVEADPTVVNRSPFETFFEEKRPFFVEGARFFDHRDFDLFYSRRIGLDDENSRIRLAGKLTGKAAGNVSVGGLYAATDVTDPGQAHNLFKNGHDVSHYLVGRIGKDFADGAHRVHFMQTAVLRSKERLEEDDDGREFRDGFTTGADMALDFADRKYNVRGSVVGSIVDPHEVKGDPAIDHAPGASPWISQVHSGLSTGSISSSRESSRAPTRGVAAVISA